MKNKISPILYEEEKKVILKKVCAYLGTNITEITNSFWDSLIEKYGKAAVKPDIKKIVAGVHEVGKVRIGGKRYEGKELTLEIIEAASHQDIKNMTDYQYELLRYWKKELSKRKTVAKKQ